MKYGNPGYKHIRLVQESQLIPAWEAAGYFDVLKGMTYPCEMTTAHEVEYLVHRISSITPDELDYALYVDTNLYDVWSAYADSLGVRVSGDELHARVSVYEPIVDYLKLHFSRPRPFQVAGMLGLPMYPHVKEGSTDSAYPSGHTFDSLCLYHLLSESHPEHRKEWMQMVMDVKDTREALGVHYPSDSLFSFQVYHHLRPYMTLHTPFSTT